MTFRFAQVAIVLALALLAVRNSATAQTPAKQAVDAPVTGEDLELGPQKSALARLRDKLRRASDLLAEKQTDRSVVDLQEEIGFDLKDLLRQTAGSLSQTSGKTAQQAANDPTDQNRSETPNANNAEKNTSAGKNGPSGASRNPLKSLVRDSWGHLPDRARQELQGVSGEDFLPKYQRMIERYYRRLADEATRNKLASPGENKPDNNPP